MTVVGFIGLGAMGAPMSGNLLKAGYEVWGHDLSPDAMAQFTARGGRAANTPAHLLEHADIVFTMLPTARHVHETYLGDEGIFAHATSRHLLLDSSTIGVGPALRLHEAARERGLRFLDAPVTGAVPAATAGTLVFIVGGRADLAAEAEPVLLQMGKKAVHAGQAGQGQAIKICNNMAAGIIKGAICEAFVLGEKMGVDPKLFFEVASEGSAQSFALNVLCPVPGILPKAPSSHDYRNGFTTSLMHKDLMLACDAAAAVDAPVALARQAAELFGDCAASGYGDLDNSVLYQYLRR